MKSKLFRQILFSEKGIRLGWNILIFILLIVLSEILIVDPIGWLLEKIGIGGVKDDVAQDWVSAFGSVIKRMSRTIVVVFITLLTLRLFLKASARDIGLDVREKSITGFLIGVGLGFVVEIISVILMAIMGWYKITGFSWNFNSLSVLSAAYVYAIFFCIETGVIEEVMFRGFLIKLVSDRYDLKIAVVASSIIFGLLHFSGSNNAFPWWAALVSATVAGFMFAQAFLVHRNLWLPIGIHFAWHFAGRTLGTVGVAGENALFLATEVQGPILLVDPKSGGAGLCELVGVFVVSLILWKMSNKAKKNTTNS
jgi:membrane protease YdiL (CAAX protease family)